MSFINCLRHDSYASTISNSLIDSCSNLQNFCYAIKGKILLPLIPSFYRAYPWTCTLGYTIYTRNTPYQIQHNICHYSWYTLYIAQYIFYLLTAMPDSKLGPHVIQGSLRWFSLPSSITFYPVAQCLRVSHPSMWWLSVVVQCHAACWPVSINMNTANIAAIITCCSYLWVSDWDVGKGLFEFLLF